MHVTMRDDRLHNGGELDGMSVHLGVDWKQLPSCFNSIGGANVAHITTSTETET